MKIFEVKNWFLPARLSTGGSFKGSTYRKLRRDMLNIASQLEVTLNDDLKEHHFNAQRRRAKLMLESIEQIDTAMQQLLFAGSEHNCFHVRTRTEQLKSFLTKYSILLDKYNNGFLEKIHKAIVFKQYNGLVLEDNLIIKEGGEIDIINK